MMKSFLLKIVIFIFTSFIILSFITLFLFNGRTDSFYPKFSSKKTPSLVIGTSRASQDIIPTLFNESDLQFKRPMFNFAFSYGNSQFGEVYLKAIKNKVESNKTKNSLFIVEIGPISVINIVDEYGNEDTLHMFESANPIGRVHNFTINPNIEYVLHADRPGFSLLREIAKTFLGGDKIYTHKDGWVELIPSNEQNSIDNRKTITRSNYDFYKRTFQNSKYSSYRINYFKETIKYLKQYGNVYLVRPPVSKEIYELEQTFFPHFDKMIFKLSKEFNVSYSNLKFHNHNYITSDGNHLMSESAKDFTLDIINNIEKSQE